MSHPDPTLYYRIAHAHEGSSEDRRRRYGPIARLVRQGDTVLDIGCGEGIFLELARDRGAGGIGIDLDPDKVDAARAKGLEAHCARAQELDIGERRVDFVSLIHIVEHMMPRDAVELLEKCTSLLSDRGRLFILTPNISHPVVQTNFWLDVTHVRPYPALLLETIVHELGLPHCQTGKMSHDLETWCYAFRDRDDALPRPLFWRRRADALYPDQ